MQDVQRRQQTSNSKEAPVSPELPLSHVVSLAGIIATVSTEISANEQLKEQLQVCNLVPMVHDLINSDTWDLALRQLLYCHAGNLYQRFVYARGVALC